MGKARVPAFTRRVTAVPLIKTQRVTPSVVSTRSRPASSLRAAEPVTLRRPSSGLAEGGGEVFPSHVLRAGGPSRASAILVTTGCLRLIRGLAFCSFADPGYTVICKQEMEHSRTKQRIHF